MPVVVVLYKGKTNTSGTKTGTRVRSHRAFLREPLGGKGLLKIALFSREISYTQSYYRYDCLFFMARE
jgi:hypothetical protein